MDPFRGSLVDHHLSEIRKQLILSAPEPTRLGLSRRELQKYSLARAILASAHGKLAAEAPFELEVSKAEARVRGLPEPLGPASFYVPDEALQKRDLTIAEAGALVQTDVNDLGLVGQTLRTMSVVARLGVQLEPNMRGDVSVPIVTTPPTPTWIEVDGVTQAGEAQPTIINRYATPKTVAALTPISHQMLVQTPGLAERLALTELAAALATATDSAFLSGSGNAGQPHGIVGLTNVGSVSGTSLAYDDLLEFQSDVLDANALRTPASFAYVTTPTVAKLLASRQRFTGTDAVLWEGSLVEGICAGARAVATASAPASTIVAGDFSTAIMFFWPGLLLAADPFTGFRTGVVTLRAMLSMDFILLRPQAFSVATSVT